MAIFSGIAALVTGLAGAAGIGAAGAALIGAGAANLARSLAVSLFLNAITPKQTIPKSQLRATINQATGPRTKLYGQGLLGGTRAFWEVDGNKLYQIAVVNHGALDGTAIAFWVDGKPVSVDADGVVLDEIYDSNLTIKYRAGGLIDGGDYPEIKAVFPTIWTDDHKLVEQATMMAIMTAADGAGFSRSFPKGPSTDIQLEARGALVYDPRLILIDYSDNSGLVAADYMQSADGWNIDITNFDTDLCNQFYDLCDTEIVRKAGGTRKQYRAWGVVDLTAPPKSELARILSTCNAQVYQTAEGKVAFMGGVYEAPDVTITGDDILKFNLVENTDNMDAFNVIKGIYTSVDHAYQDTEAEPLENAASLLVSPEKSFEFDSAMVPDHGQMRQLMKLELNRQNRPFTLSITTNLVGIKARFPKGIGYHVIRVKNDDMDFNEVCEVTGFNGYAEADENGVMQFRYDIELAGIDPAWNEFDPITEEGDAPISPEILETEGVPVPVVTTLEQFSAGGGKGVRVTVADISRPDLVLIARIRVSPSGSYSSMVASELQAESVGRTVGQAYDVTVKYAGGEYSTPTSITIS